MVEQYVHSPIIYDNIFTYRCDYLRDFELDVGFIDHLYTRLRTTSNYMVTANLPNSQSTIAPAKHYPACYVFTNRSLATASSSGDSSASRS
jgi:hypothetical protein